MRYLGSMTRPIVIGDLTELRSEVSRLIREIHARRFNRYEFHIHIKSFSLFELTPVRPEVGSTCGTCGAEVRERPSSPEPLPTVCTSPAAGLRIGSRHVQPSTPRKTRCSHP